MQALHCSTEFFLTNFKNDWARCYEKLIAQTGVNVFVESGTYLGDTSQKAAGYFQEIHTVELNEKKCNSTKTKRVLAVFCFHLTFIVLPFCKMCSIGPS